MVFQRSILVLVFVSNIWKISCTPLGSHGSTKPLVTIGQGKLLGKSAWSRDGRQFYQFHGIPYGKIPRRFDIAIPADNWDGIKNSTQPGPICVWANKFGVGGPFGVEDCLFLDIATPKIPSKDNLLSLLLPVIVYIHGGGFFSGSATTYGPKYLMDEDVVLVAINFRLGAFGLLNAGVESARGNQALKDQVLALKWVRDNIKEFGGDPTRVTIMGESTGGGSVSLLTLSPMAQGLFSRAIMQSGVASAPQLILHGNPGIKYAKMLGAELDCPTRNLTAMVECLRNLPAEDIAALSVSPTDEFSWIQDGIHLGPTIETFSEGPHDKNVFLAEDPYVIAARGEFARVPMMIGQIAQETINVVTHFFSDSDFVSRLNLEFGRRLPQYLLYYNAAIDPCTVTRKLKMFYFNDQNLTKESAFDFDRLHNDRLVTHPTRKMAEAYAKYTDVYLFNFTRSKAHEYAPPVHGDDLYYIFNYVSANEVNLNDDDIRIGDGDYQFSKGFIRSIVTFARDGKPSLWGNHFMRDTEWKSLTPGQPQEWLQLNDKPFMQKVDQAFLDSWTLWDSLELAVV